MEVDIGIDLGGSHVAIGVLKEHREIIEQFEKDFTIEEKKNLINVAIDYITEVINDLKNKYEFDKFGIGIAGEICNGVILKSVNLNIENYHIKQILEERTNLKVIVNNDGKCAAIAEYKYGGINEFQNVLFLNLGTGIGGSYIYHGEIMEGSVFRGMEVGHMVIKENGILCKCGKKGCFEKYASILAFKTKIIERLNLTHNISGPELRSYMAENKEKIQDIEEEYLSDVTLGLSNLINIFEPECIVLGGGFARYDYILLDKLKDKLLNSNLLFNHRNQIEIRCAKLGNDAGIIGASMQGQLRNS